MGGKTNIPKVTSVTFNSPSSEEEKKRIKKVTEIVADIMVNHYQNSKKKQ